MVEKLDGGGRPLDVGNGDNGAVLVERAVVERDDSVEDGVTGTDEVGSEDGGDTLEVEDVLTVDAVEVGVGEELVVVVSEVAEGAVVGEAAELAEATTEVVSLVTVCVSTTVTGGAVVCSGSIETIETSVSVAVTVFVASLAEAVMVSVFGDDVTVWTIVVADSVDVVPPSIGTTE